VGLLPEIAAAVGTPLYVYDADLFRARIRALEAALGDAPHQVCYAVKANDALALLRIAAAERLGADIVSGGELYRCELAGMPGERILFSGVGKQPHEIDAALRAGVRSINAILGESRWCLRPRVDRRAGLGATEPDVDADAREDATGSAVTKFGLGFDDALVALERVATDDRLEPINFHLGRASTPRRCRGGRTAWSSGRRPARVLPAISTSAAGSGWPTREARSSTSVSTRPSRSARRRLSAPCSCSSRAAGSSAG
jgi:diaminopimelate decarboxylase